MTWSISDILSLVSILTTVVSVATATAIFMLKFGQITNEVKNLGMRVDKLEIRMDKLEIRMDKLEIRMDKIEKKVDEIGKKLVEILHFLSHKSKKYWKR